MAKRSRKQGFSGKSRASVVVCIPVREQVSAWFAYDLARLMGYTGATMTGQSVNALQIVMGQGTYIAPQRIELAKAALAANATHILWLDSDMRFPKNSLEVLLGHNKDVVGANYVSRMPPHFFVAKHRLNPEIPLVTYDDSTGLVEAEAIGFGVCLTKVSLFRGMKQPWFDLPFKSGDDAGFQGEDVGFCARVRLAGKSVFVDHDLSHYVQHIGLMSYSYIHGLDALEYYKRVEEGLQDGSDH